jgi:hypothetical protein
VVFDDGRLMNNWAATQRLLVPAAASTAGIVNTPVPMMLPITSPVAEGRPSPPPCFWLGDDAGWADSTGGCCTGRVLVVPDIGSLSDIPAASKPGGVLS